MDHREFSRRGGLARARNLTHEQIQEIGRKGGLKSGKVRRKKAREKKKKTRKKLKTEKPLE